MRFLENSSLLVLMLVIGGGCVQTDAKEVAFALPKVSVSLQDGNGVLQFVGTVKNVSDQPICIGKPTISIYYPDIFETERDLTLVPVRALGYSGLSADGGSLIVVPPDSEMTFRDSYAKPSIDGRYIAILGGSLSEQDSLSVWEREQRARGNYAVKLAANIFQCPVAATSGIAIGSGAFVVPFDLKPNTAKQALDVRVADISLVGRR